MISQKATRESEFRRGSKTPWGGTYVRCFQIFAVVDSRNSGFTLINEPVVADPVAQHGHFCISSYLFFSIDTRFRDRQASDRDHRRQVSLSLYKSFTDFLLENIFLIELIRLAFQLIRK